MAHKLLLLLLTCFQLAPTAALANAPEPLTLGVYVPRFAFNSTLERTQYAQEMGVVLSRVTGLTVRARAFTRAEDLQTFRRTNRLDLALVDSAFLAAHAEGTELIGVGTGPNGTQPDFAVLSRSAVVGIRSLEGRRLALVDAGSREKAVLSNYAFEGEVSVDRFFGRIRVAAEMKEVLGWLDTNRADCTVGYAWLGERTGLHIVARLKGIPLPVLVGFPEKLAREHRERLQRALSHGGLAIPVHGALNRLVQPRQSDPRNPLQSAAALQPGSRALRNALWSPTRAHRLGPELQAVRPRGSYPLPQPVNPWRIPDFAEP